MYIYVSIYLSFFLSIYRFITWFITWFITSISMLFVGDISIVHGVYEPTYNWGASPCEQMLFLFFSSWEIDPKNIILGEMVAEN